MIKIVVLKENQDDNRVSFTPNDLSVLTRRYEIYVQSKAGEASGFTDELYLQAGAKIFINPKIVLPKANCIFKLSPLTAKELKLVNQQQYLFTNPYFLSHPEILKQYLFKGLSVIALEKINLASGNYRDAYQKILGKFGVITGLFYTSKLFNKNSIGRAFSKDFRALVVNYSIAAHEAIHYLLGLGVDVTLAEIEQPLINRVKDDEIFNGLIQLNANPLHIINNTFDELSKNSHQFDLIINTCDLANKNKLKITYDMITGLHNGAVFIDLGTDLGFGSDLTEKPNNAKKPYTVFNNKVCVSMENVASLYPADCSSVISQIYTKLLNDSDANQTNIVDFINANHQFAHAQVLSVDQNGKGIIVDQPLAKDLDLKFK
ncbi:MAG: hypothetical protein LBC33_02645 [Mycoplasmataceae bacterium]|jgi:alanine dehydrogenase|nr:hypothetical protein [Mycoplasmataceae bacterium]